jgi:adenomatosis polyposis coli protein
MKESESGDTWGDETANDVSFPSLSISAPIVESYHSENEDKRAGHTIQLESGRVAIISHLDLEESNYLDQIQPPSNMASIISLNSSLTDNKKLFKLSDSILDNTDSFQVTLNIKSYLIRFLH